MVAKSEESVSGAVRISEGESTVDFTKPIYIDFPIVKSSARVWYLEGEKSYRDGYPYVIVRRTAQGNGPTYYEPFDTNDDGKCYKHSWRVVNNPAFKVR